MSADERPAWIPYDEKTNNRCLNCDAHVMPQTVRVFSDNSGKLHKCPKCTTFRDLHSTEEGI